MERMAGKCCHLMLAEPDGDTLHGDVGTH